MVQVDCEVILLTTLIINEILHTYQLELCAPKPGEYIDQNSGWCKQCTECTYEVNSVDMEPQCMDQPCPRWCSIEYATGPKLSQPKLTCSDDPMPTAATVNISNISTQPSIYNHTTIHDATSAEPVPSDPWAALIGLSAVGVILIAVIAYCCKKKNTSWFYQKLKANAQPNTRLKTFMIDPTTWKLELQSSTKYHSPRFWLTVANTETSEQVYYTEWKNDSDIMEVSLPPSGGSFSAYIEITKKHNIKKSIEKSNCLRIVVPSEPCTTTIDNLTTDTSPDNLYHRLRMDLNTDPDSVWKIACIINIKDVSFTENVRRINNNLCPFDDLIQYAKGNGFEFKLAHVVMGLMRGKMSDRDKRVVGYILNSHKNCTMCRHIKQHNTGEQVVSASMVNSPPINVSLPV